MQGQVKAVDGVSFTIREGETFGLVGESGSGKTTLGRCIVRGIEPTEGQILFRLPEGDEVDIAALDRKGLREVRKHFHMIFQDPYSSLDPRMSILDIIAEPIRNNKLLTDTREVQDRVRELMDKVGLDIQHLIAIRTPFPAGSGNASVSPRALAPSPLLIVCDEAVSALDVSIQAQILNLLEDLQEEFNLTFLFIAHDLSVVEHISDRVGVMYVGQLVEMADTESLFASPKHPYTEALLSAVPTTDPEIKWIASSCRAKSPIQRPPPSGCYSIRAAVTPRTSAKPRRPRGPKSSLVILPLVTSLKSWNCAGSTRRADGPARSRHHRIGNRRCIGRLGHRMDDQPRNRISHNALFQSQRIHPGYRKSAT